MYGNSKSNKVFETPFLNRFCWRSVKLLDICVFAVQVTRPVASGLNNSASSPTFETWTLVPSLASLSKANWLVVAYALEAPIAVSLPINVVNSRLISWFGVQVVLPLTILLLFIPVLWSAI